MSGKVSGQERVVLHQVPYTLEYEQIVHDPRREVYLPMLRIRSEAKRQEASPFLDFIMNLDGVMNMVGAGAAVLLTALLAVQM